MRPINDVAFVAGELAVQLKPEARPDRKVRGAESTGRVERAPGWRFLEFARLVFPPKLVERVVAQVVADLREEYVNALASNRRGLARWIRIRGYFILVQTLVLLAGVEIVKRFHGIAKRISW